jgi:hypothetical protein
MTRASIVCAWLVALAACRHAPAHEDAEESPKPRKNKLDAGPSDETVARFGNIALGLEPYGVVPLDEDGARGRWHVRIVSRKGTIERAERVSPSGRIFTTWRYARGDGGLTSTERDARDVEVGRTRVSSDGLRTFTARSGVVGEGGCHHLHVDYDDDGVQRERRCLDAENKPVPDQDGCAVRVVEHDARKLTTKLTCLDGDGKPATFSSGAHAMAYDYDRWGMTIRTRLFGLDGRPLAHGAACASDESDRDDAGDLVEWRCLDGDGAIVRARKSKLDRNGCLVRLDNVTATGAPMLWDGIASQLYRRDEVCTILEEESRDVDGKRVGAVARRKYLLDDEGNKIETRCFDASDAPVSCSNGIGTDGSIGRTKFDDRGRIVRTRAYRADESKSRSNASVDHEIRTTFGADGRKERDEYFDVDGRPGKGNGAASLHYRYDSLGAEVSQTYFDATGAPMIAMFGCHELRTTYDDHHALTSKECFDVAGKLRDSNLCQGTICWGKHTARILVERREGHVDNLHYDARGALTSRVSCEKERCFR